MIEFAKDEAEPAEFVSLNTGHGHVHPRPDGVLARCGGPGVCDVCSREAAAANAGAERFLADVRKPEEEVEAQWRKDASAEIAGAQSGGPTPAAQELTEASAQIEAPERTPDPAVGAPAVTQGAPRAPRRRRLSEQDRRLVVLAGLVNQATGAGTRAEVLERGMRRLREAGIRASVEEVAGVLEMTVADVLAPQCTCSAEPVDSDDPPPGPQHSKTCPRWRPL